MELSRRLDIIDLAFECDGWVFSHAGFSATWVESILKVFHQMLDKWPDDEEAESPELVWDENGEGRCTVGIWFKPLQDDVAHSISKKYQLYKG